MPAQIDLLIDNVHVVTMNDAWDEFPDGAVAISGQRIHEVGDANTLRERYPAAPRHDGQGALLTPGFINTHTHLAMAYFKGLADDMELQTWLQEHIWPAEQRWLSDEFVYHASMHGAAELLRGGTTTFCDMYFYETATARACRELGVRAHLSEGILSFPAHGHADAQEMIDYNIAQHAAFADDDLITFELGPHAIYTCNREDLLKVAVASLDHNMRVQLHLSETKKEAADCLEQHRLHPMCYLRELGLLGPHVNLAHCVWLNDEEISILADTGTNVSHCGRSNLKLASGVARVADLVKAGVSVTLGADGVASNNSLSIFSEMSLVGRLHKALDDDPTLLPARDVVAMCTRGAAAALQRSDIGVVEPGRRADLALIDIDTVEAAPMYDPYSHLVYVLGARDVRDVFVNGKQVVKNRSLVYADEVELIARARAYRKQILQG